MIVHCTVILVLPTKCILFSVYLMFNKKNSNMHSCLNLIFLCGVKQDSSVILFQTNSKLPRYHLSVSHLLPLKMFNLVIHRIFTYIGICFWIFFSILWPCLQSLICVFLPQYHIDLITAAFWFDILPFFFFFFSLSLSQGTYPFK